MEVRDEDIREIELPQLDLDQYIGNEVKITSVDLKKGEYGYYYLATAEEVDKELGIEPTKILGLHKDAEGTWGWAAHTKTGQYLAKMKCKHPKDLVGKKVKVQIRANKEGTEFLTF